MLCGKIITSIPVSFTHLGPNKLQETPQPLNMRKVLTSDPNLDENTLKPN